MAAPKTPQDHQPKADEREATEAKVTIDGVEYTVNLKALQSPRTADDLGVLQEAESQAPDIDKELAAELTMRIPGLLRRILGYPGSRKMHSELERIHGDEYSFQHATGFLIKLIQGVRPNS